MHILFYGTHLSSAAFQTQPTVNQPPKSTLLLIAVSDSSRTRLASGQRRDDLYMQPVWIALVRVRRASCQKLILLTALSNNISAAPSTIRSALLGSIGGCAIRRAGLYDLGELG